MSLSLSFQGTKKTGSKKRSRGDHNHSMLHSHSHSSVTHSVPYPDAHPQHCHYRRPLLQLQAHNPPNLEGGAPGSAQPATQAVNISIEFSYVKAIGVVCVKTKCSTLQVATCRLLGIGCSVSVTRVGYRRLCSEQRIAALKSRVCTCV